MLIAQDTCSNENNIPVYVQQIFQKLKSFQNNFWSNLAIPELKVRMVRGWEMFSFNEKWNPLLKC